jgi:putative MATE family efflux protein
MTTTTVTGRKPSIWAELGNALKGTEADYTQIGLKRAIFLLAIPMILELVMESTFAVVDIYFVGKLGASAVATVGLTETYLFLVYSVAMGLATAVTAVVSRRVGEHDAAGAGKAAVQSILVACAASVPFMVAGIFYAPELLQAMGADNWALTQGVGYTRWMLGGNLIIMLLFVINAIYRGAGDASIAMRVLWISNVINILLDPLLIFGFGPVPALGIEGAAIATNIGRAIGVLVQLWYLFGRGNHIAVTRTQCSLDLTVMLSILRTSLGGIGQMLISMTAWIFLMRILADIGSAAVAGATIAIRVMMFTLMPAWGLSNAAATLVGQNLGAGSPQRAERSVWMIGLYNMAFLILVSIAYFIFRDSIMGIFTQDASVIAVGSEWLGILALSYFVYGWWMVSVQAFNGAGDTRTPTLINLVFFWMIQIPLCYYLAQMLGWKESGVFWGVFLSETSVGLFTLWLFSKGRWKQVKV